MASDGDLDVCAEKIARLEQCTKNLEKLHKELSSKKGNVRSILQKVEDEEDSGNKLAAETWKVLKSKKNDRNLDQRLRGRVDKLVEQFGDAGNQFENVSRQVLEKRKTLSAQEFDGQDLEAGGRSSEQHQQQKPALEQALLEDTDIQDMLVTEKNQALRQMENELGDLHAIFKDVATLVHSQQEGLDSIESAVNETTVRVTAGTNELIKAKKHQTAARKRMCCLVVTGSVVVTLLVYCVLGPLLR
mmetsp:Transcript_11331/g.22773  ORF Transcript_11331/g.22773 Transcript_11331/m.22773 type:complete len:245 (-) Transcript_11331:141-875(-)|eukprot:CAMPEP_0181322864 /NCGR_PEP_ID=MMETSP1101-20121128/19463_1 /TAXON_ID=46948 /ORGANISM="Rhodomonas abbreviata, Strain Caron Lab Isolate" /LENGTH=244 /DNA_ID=CAMNT_0023430821 /DNA_START=275 /DNA_END=1009 /DNA_ORIENTATION=+